MSTIKTVKDINTQREYDIIEGTGLIFDFREGRLFYCTDDHEKSQWSDQSFTFEIEGKDVIFYVIEVLSYDTIKDIAEVIRIQEMEHDKEYMDKKDDMFERIAGPLKQTFGNISKEKQEDLFSCVNCDYKMNGVNNPPCNACVDHYFHSQRKNKCDNQIMIKNNTSIIPEKKHIEFIIDLYWKDELRDFCEVYEVELQSQDSLIDWIVWCDGNHENINYPNPPTNHIFYHLMKLKQLYNL